MTWLRLDDGFVNHPKVCQLGGPPARWTWLEVLSYCARYDTDGRIPAGIHKAVRRATPAFLESCANVGLVDRDDTGLVVHDWTIYNGNTIEDKIVAYLKTHPGAGANEVHKAIGGKRALVLNIVAAVKSGSRAVPERYPSVPETGTPEPAEVVPNRYPSRARANPSPKEQQQQQTMSREDHAAAADLETMLKTLGWNHGQRLAGQAEPDRSRAWALKAQAVAERNPGGYAWTGFDGGEWPTEPIPEQNGKPTRPLIDILTDFINGPGAHYPDEAILDEIGIHERKHNELITQEQKTELLELATQLRNRIPNGVE